MSDENIRIEETVRNDTLDGEQELSEDETGDATVTIREEEVHLKTKFIPAIIMLLAGAVTALTAFIRHYPVLLMLELTFGALLLFLFIGEIAKILLDRIVVIRRVEVTDNETEEEMETDDAAVLEDGDSGQGQAEN